MTILNELHQAFPDLRVTREGGQVTFDPADFTHQLTILSWDGHEPVGINVPMEIGSNHIWPIVAINDELSFRYRGGACGDLDCISFRIPATGGCYRISTAAEPQSWTPTRNFVVYRIFEKQIDVAVDLTDVRVTMRWLDRRLSKVTLYRRKRGEEHA